MSLCWWEWRASLVGVAKLHWWEWPSFIGGSGELHGGEVAQIWQELRYGGERHGLSTDSPAQPQPVLPFACMSQLS